MKIYEEVLSEKLLNKCKQDILKKQSEYVWGSSSFLWEYGLLEHIDGVCLSTKIDDDEIVNLLTTELSIAFVDYEYKQLSYQYYVWDSYSGIAPHEDGVYKFGATLYLNSNDLLSGGLFLWQDEECTKHFYRGLNPQENMMVVNDNKQCHFVTPISPHAKQYRYTIQIWGE